MIAKEIALTVDNVTGGLGSGSVNEIDITLIVYKYINND